MKKPTPEEIIAASYPAIQERAREMDKETDPAIEKLTYGPMMRYASSTPKPDVTSNGAETIASFYVTHDRYSPTPCEPAQDGRWTCSKYCPVRVLALAIDEHTRKRIHEEWLATREHIHAEYEAENMKLREALDKVWREVAFALPAERRPIEHRIYRIVLEALATPEALNAK